MVRRLRWVVVAVLAVWMSAVVVHWVRTLVRFYSPLPYWDYWVVAEHLNAYLHFDPRALWQQHNEHRIVFPKAFFALDYILLRGREVFPVVLSALFYVSTSCILFATLWRASLNLFARLCAITLAGIVMAWEASALSIDWPFLLQWTLSEFTAVCSLVLLVRARDSKRPSMSLAAAISLAVVANYSSANCLLLWPVLLVAGLIRRLSVKQLAALLTAAVLSVGLYFAGYHFSPEMNVAALIEHPLMFAGFVDCYMAMPFSTLKPVYGIWIGSVCIVGFGALIAVAARRRVLDTQQSIVLFGTYSLGILTAVIAAAGRMNPKDPTFLAATAQRYIVVPLISWAALILAAAWLLAQLRRPMWIPVLGVFALGWAAMLRSPHVDFWLDLNRDDLSGTQLAALGFDLGVDDSGLMRRVFPSPPLVRKLLPVLREKRLSTFATPQPGWLGKPADSVFTKISDQRQPGAVTNVYPVESGLIVVGWTDAPPRIWKPQQLVFLNERKEIVGIGRKWTGKLPQGLGSFDTPESLAWMGVVNLNFEARLLSAYIVERRGRLFPIGEPFAIPPVRALRADQAGAVIAALSWHAEGAWIKNGAFPDKPAGMPSDIAYFESWAGGDNKVGVLTSTVFENPAGNCVVVDGAHGPLANRVSIQLLDADSGETIASMPLMSGDLVWRWWQVKIPSNSRRLKVVARDDGRDWGEWLALGEPRECK